MFEIEYRGGNAVTLSSKKVTIAVDPSMTIFGLKNPKFKDAVELLTEERFRVVDADLRLTIDSPGEYEVGDFTIRSAAASRFVDDESAEKLSTIYRLELGDVKVAILGNIQPRLSDDQLETLGVVDVLIIPVGGGGTLDATNAAVLVRTIEPKVVVPVHYAESGLNYEVPQDVLDTFVKELGAPVEDTVKLKIKSAASLPAALTIYKLARV